MRAYSELYVDDVMTQLGAMYDFAVNTCHQEMSLFHARFLSSGIAERISSGDPKYAGGMSGIETALEVARRTGSTLESASQMIDAGSPEYWTGWALAYIQWYLNRDFSKLQKGGLDIIALHKRYPALHEADISKTVDYAQRVLDDYSRLHNPLKEARRDAGFTQNRLAFESGVSLRAIRAYEQGQLSLASASAGSLRNMERVLGCTLL